jgi:hypothetical protein
MHIFPYTNYIGQCCQMLLDAGEYESDKLLVALVRMQRVLSRVSAAFPNPEVENPMQSVFYAPLHMTMSTTRIELDAFIKGQPEELKTNCEWKRRWN